MATRRPLSRDVVLPRLLTSADAPPRSQQVYGALRDLVLSGRFESGARPPSSRTLAAAFAVARNTVLAAIERLCAEEVVECARGSGCRVATPMALVRDRPVPPVLNAPRVPPPESPPSRPRAFALGLPAVDQFPIDLWARLVRRRWRGAGPSLLGYAPPGGYRPLRQAIAAHLGATRAVQCHWSQVVITPGVRPALALTARAVLDPGDTAWVEDPGYAPGVRALEAEGLRVIPVDIDSQGLSVASGTARAPRARAAFITPSHQFPLGVTMSLARRLELLRWAAAGSRWIIEDDYDSEFRHVGPPLASLQGLDPHQRVI